MIVKDTTYFTEEEILEISKDEVLKNSYVKIVGFVTTQEEISHWYGGPEHGLDHYFWTIDLYADLMEESLPDPDWELDWFGHLHEKFMGVMIKRRFMEKYPDKDWSILSKTSFLAKEYTLPV